MKLELAILAGAESKAFLRDFKLQLDRLEELAGKVGGTKRKRKAKAAEETEEEEENDENEEQDGDADADSSDDDGADSDDDADEAESDGDFDESDDADEADEAEEEEEGWKKAKGKTAKVSAEEVNEACKKLHVFLVKKKKFTSKKAFTIIKALLQKNFETDSVSKIEKADRARALKLINAKMK